MRAFNVRELSFNSKVFKAAQRLQFVCFNGPVTPFGARAAAEVLEPGPVTGHRLTLDQVTADRVTVEWATGACPACWSVDLVALAWTGLGIGIGLVKCKTNGRCMWWANDLINVLMLVLAPPTQLHQLLRVQHSQLH